MKKNILFVGHDTSLFGANQSLINMISSIKDAGEDVIIITVFPDRGLICNQFDDLGLEYKIVKYKTEASDPNKSLKARFLNFLRFVNKITLNALALRKLRRIVKLNNITIVHSNSSIVAIGEDLAKLEGIKHVWHLREYIDLDHDLGILGGLKKHKERIQKAKNIICISKGIAKHFDIENKAFILYNAVRKEKNNVLEKNKVNYFLFCGSLVKNKGIEEAILAFTLVYHFDKNINLLIAGSGSSEYENFLKEMVIQRNLQNNVQFLGFRKDTDKLMRNALALLMCSENEALGRVTIEAMLNFCIVLGFNNAGTAEIISDGVNGLLYEDRNHLATYMKRIISGDVRDLDIIRTNAYDFANNVFLEKQFGMKLMNYYSNL
ncbi:glycosyltransferase family 4 protein [Flavobacterium aestivum]|uniref:glycosyltransferase family 4 protein n=1 Tax=Flavobacterium aestivum TaxID=3003257 RepID=UPI0022860207|nr:glycosyltransferase family 4 protein [Flavobacterium aestivum]